MDCENLIRILETSVSEADEANQNDIADSLDSPLCSDDGSLNSIDFDRQPDCDGPLRSITMQAHNDTVTVMLSGEVPPQPDLNAYQHKKTLAQGMMDLALLSSNANQLRYVMESYKRHPYFYPSVIFITISIIFQIAVGVGLILNSRYNINCQSGACKANKINNFTVIGIFIITVVNVFISSFGVAERPDDLHP